MNAILGTKQKRQSAHGFLCADSFVYYIIAFFNFYIFPGVRGATSPSPSSHFINILLRHRSYLFSCEPLSSFCLNRLEKDKGDKNNIENVKKRKKCLTSFYISKLFYIFASKILITMELQQKFKVVLHREAHEFLAGLDEKTRNKIYQTFDRASFLLEPELFKKLADTDIWEFRTLYNKKKYRMLAFWDKTQQIDTLVIATHGFIKKTQKTPQKEINKAIAIREQYFQNK